MNKIVRAHYPASKLPDDLRSGFDSDATVRIVIEQQDISPDVPERGVAEKTPLFLPTYREPGAPVELADLLKDIRAYKEKRGSTTDAEEAVRRIRELRDEWDDE
ncbi:hypothetical protein LRX75_13840 [Rhizobium sp. DKSPLA3]|uniref:Uncharacterized protein n=1 Tax=Rhizobium quercicola TaxID=2901226 RepID=A0A9X1NTL3_9HYPH|nr:hypothetical protein [Rhizobium quercicola]MCD7110120.1 hypothetical protein [Rhizobium quercicola]